MAGGPPYASLPGRSGVGTGQVLDRAGLALDGSPLPLDEREVVEAEVAGDGLGLGGARGGARAGRPRQARILRATSGSAIAARRRSRPPQRGQEIASTAKTRWSNSPMRASSDGVRPERATKPRGSPFGLRLGAPNSAEVAFGAGRVRASA
jgi:hypothetical protein